MTGALPYTEDPDANALLAANPFALLVGLVLQQQIPVERAFAAPLELQRRLGGTLDAATVAATPPEELERIFSTPPALHRFPGTMAKRTAVLAEAIMADYHGDPTRIWEGVDTADDLMRRLTALPGFGEYKARILLGILARHFDVRPAGYEELLPNWPSIADVERPGDLETLKRRKKEWKASRAR